MSEPQDEGRAPSAIAGGKGVWALAWPTIALSSLHSLLGIIDLVFVSSLGNEAVAAVAVASQVHFVGFSLLGAVTTGVTAVVAREFGRGDRSAAARATRCAAVLSIGIGAAMMLAIPFSESLVAALGLAPNAAVLGGQCLVVLLLSSAPLSLEVTLSQALRGAGDVRTPLIVGALAVIVNAVADYALIFGRLGAPELGAVGSAWASALAVSGAAVALTFLWLRDRLILPGRRVGASVRAALARRILRVGIPSALEQAAFQGGLLLFMSVVASFGTEEIAAYLIGIRLLAFCFVPGFGFGMAAGTLVGQSLGAKRPDLAERAGWRSAGGACLALGGVGAVFLLAARPLAELFGAVGEETVALTVTFIYILGAVQPLMALEFALSGALRGAGDTRFPLYTVLIGLFVVRLGSAVAIVKPVFGTVVAVWLCLVADYGIKAALLTWRFRAGRWKQIEV